MQSLLDFSNMPDAGFAAWAFLLAVAAATLVSEDLTAVAVGALVAEGKVGFLFGTFACFLGIFVGDVLLYVAGRWAGRPALTRAPLKWLVNEDAVERSSAWFGRRGAWVIAASRFAPGTRLPTYFAAGMLRTSFGRFAFYFAVACAVWTPLLVALSALVGGEVVKSALFGRQHLIVGTLLAGVVLLFIFKSFLRLTTWRGRRLFVGRWRRLTRWEFWPPWAFYPPVVVYVAWLALKHRSLTLFTAANPAIESGGFVGESKIAILDGLAAGGFVARSELIPAERDGSGADERINHAGRFMAAHRLSFPVVLKPDVGQRGAGVKVARSDAEVREFFLHFSGDAIVQEYVPGEEFGVFYYRLPGAARGRIFSITEKRMPVVSGDGASTLEQLILADERAVCMARFYCEQQRGRLQEVPDEGERVQLVELGTHCRGAIFLDGARLKTEALGEAIDRVGRSYEGFYFGRFDIRAPSAADFRRGEDFKVIELNGVTSEATHIYDPRHSLFAAYRVLFAQWRIAFEIGARNRARGAEPTSARELIRLTLEFRRSVGATAG
jgi:membrane protein DedA with SNARE-associated domain